MIILFIIHFAWFSSLFFQRYILSYLHDSSCAGQEQYFVGSCKLCLMLGVS